MSMIQTTRPHNPQRHRLLPLALLLLASTHLYAQQPMSISLSGAAEVPPVTTQATGSGQITILPDRTISGSIKTSGIAASMAHVHEAPAGKNGPPIVTLSKAVNDSFVVPPNTRLTEAQYRSYTAGNLYINVHSGQHPDGEIRGQLPRPAN
jgi:CHRD domain